MPSCWCIASSSAAETSWSRNGSSSSRPSTIQTSVPSAAKVQAYSLPMTPAPTTASDRGSRSSWRIVSESSTRRMVERERRGPHRRGAGGDQDRLAPQPDLAGPAAAVRAVPGPCRARPAAGLGHDPDRVRVDERGRAVVEDHAVPGQAPLDPLPLVGRDPPLVEHEVGDGRLAAQRQVHAVEVARPAAPRSPAPSRAGSCSAASRCWPRPRRPAGSSRPSPPACRTRPPPRRRSRPPAPIRSRPGHTSRVPCQGIVPEPRARAKVTALPSPSSLPGSIGVASGHS